MGINFPFRKKYRHADFSVCEDIPEEDDKTFVLNKGYEIVILQDLGDLFKFEVVDHRGILKESSKFYKKGIVSYNLVKEYEKILFRTKELSTFEIYISSMDRHDTIIPSLSRYDADRLYEFIDKAVR